MKYELKCTDTGSRLIATGLLNSFPAVSGCLISQEKDGTHVTAQVPDALAPVIDFWVAFTNVAAGRVCILPINPETAPAPTRALER